MPLICPFEYKLSSHKPNQNSLQSCISPGPFYQYFTVVVYACNCAASPLPKACHLHVSCKRKDKRKYKNKAQGFSNARLARAQGNRQSGNVQMLIDLTLMSYAYMPRVKQLKAVERLDKGLLVLVLPRFHGRRPNKRKHKKEKVVCFLVLAFILALVLTSSYLVQRRLLSLSLCLCLFRVCKFCLFG